MAVLKVQISTKRDKQTLGQLFETPGGSRAIATRLINFVTSVCTGTEGPFSSSVPPTINFSIQENATQATGTITFSGVGAAADTIIINGVTFTAVASGATGNQWNVGGSAAISASNLASAINASATALVNTQVTASAANGVCTITSQFYSYAGNAVTIAKGTDSTGAMTVSGARLTGGAPDASALNLTF